MEVQLDQGPSLSCNECRRRKSKCDRVRPNCRNCVMSGSDCIFPGDNRKRGPKKGQMQALRTRIATLEQQLAARDMSWTMPLYYQDATMKHHDELPQCTQPTATMFEPENLDTLIFDTAPPLSWPENGSMLLDSISKAELFPTALSSTLSHAPVSPLVLSDLEELYFDRVYQSAPIIHRGRYLACRSQGESLPACDCLRLAMCTSASAFSARFDDVGERLYLETLRRLEDLESNEYNFPWGHKDLQIEEIQAWLLIAIYEYIRKSKNNATSSASRALRLIQRCRLGDLDASDISGRDGGYDTSATKDDFALMEGKRRTFWLAFCFERWLNTDDNANWVLSEEMIRLRVPASEANFQQSQETKTQLLSEIMAEGNDELLPPFAECVALMTVYGRCVSHRQLVQTATAVGRPNSGFWKRHKWLMSAAEKRLRLVPTPDATSGMLENDAVTVFTCFLVRSLVLHLVGTTDLWPWHTAEQKELCLIFAGQAHMAVHEQARLAESISCLSGFKFHPFLRTLLASSVDFIKEQSQMTHQADLDGFHANLSALTKVLQRLKDTNQSAKEISGQVLKSAESDPELSILGFYNNDEASP